MEYEVVIGLEVHTELATKTKIFCSCSTQFGGGANTHICPGCAGMPGTLPVVNKKVIEFGIAAALVTNSKINQYTTFDKKNYFYPDLACSYQITQLFHPICVDGSVEIETSQGKKTIGLKQIHMEEDAGKLKHDPFTDSSLVDYNRSSMPLLEIVSKPDFRSAEEVVAYLEKLRSMLKAIGVSDCKMQEGSMRADINLSVRPLGSTKLGVRAEMKNMNSLKSITRAIEYETARHIDLIESGNAHKLKQETRRWDDEKGKTYAMRSKENAQDYRYFPNPDLPPIVISDEWIERVRQSLPELPEAKFARYTEELGLSEGDSRLLTGSKVLSDLCDHCIQAGIAPQTAANWITGEVMNLAKNDGKLADDLVLRKESLAKLIGLVEKNVINRNTAKKVLAEVYHKDVDPEEYVKANGLAMVSDKGAIKQMVKDVLAANEKVVADYKSGKTQARGFLFGQIMKQAKGKADTKLINELLNEQLG